MGTTFCEEAKGDRIAEFVSTLKKKTDILTTFDT